MEIRSKAEFFKRWIDGELGNRTRIWKDPFEALRDAREFGIQEIGFREVRPRGSTGAGRWERVPREDLLVTALRWKTAKLNFIMDDAAPTERMTLQGEICRTYRGLEGFLDEGSKLPMRPAMAQGKLTARSPLETLMMIRKYMDGSSQDDLWLLLDLYPDAAVEFCCFSVKVGVFPNRNTIFWETRNY